MMMRRILRPCNKKRKTDDDVDVVVPVDIVMEILNRLPADFVTRCLLVSKSWQEIIRSKAFLRSFPFRKSVEPFRLLMGFLVAADDASSQTGGVNYSLFTSSSSLSSSLSSSSSTSIITTSFQSRLAPGSPKYDLGYYPTYYVNGLINRGECIFNPCSGKSITLPHLKTTRTSTFVPTFFGYDPVNHEYKVLSMSPKNKDAHPWWTDHFHVLTLGGRGRGGANQDQEEEPYWRVIHSSVPHRPRTSGLCMDGSVYYIAYTGPTGQEQSVVRFDLNSEKFDIFSGVSETIRTYRLPPTPINYYGKVAVGILPIIKESRVDFFVFQAGKQDVLERSIHNLPERFLYLKGINHYTCELVFAPYLSRDEAYVFLYDLKEATCKKIKIEVDTQPNSNLFSEGAYFLDYVESLMLL